MNKGILFDVPFEARETKDGRIVVKMNKDDHFVDCSEIPKRIKTYYNQYRAACAEYSEATEGL